jgi:hypothetical protein
MPDSPILFLVIGGLVLGFGAWAGWTVGARRARSPKPPPDRLWLCDGCHSFNEPEREACYGCHRPRPVDARSVVPDAEFHIDQRFGQAADGGGRGSSRPWLGAVDPLRDEWLAGRPSTEPVVPPADEASPPADDDTTRADTT